MERSTIKKDNELKDLVFLRDKTGFSLRDCKKALSYSNNDIDEAYDLLCNIAVGRTSFYDIELKQYKDIEEELGIDLITLFKALKSKQCGLRYFDKIDAITNKCEVGWYVQMLLYGLIPVKDFINSLTKEELE